MEFKPERYRNPQCVIHIDGSPLKIGSCYIESVNVQISAAAQSNSCDVTLIADYDHKNGKISDDLSSRITAGKKAEVKLGYEKPDTVFLGYINSVSTSFSAEGIIMTFSCLDARGLLMGNTQWQSYENEKLSMIVEGILNPIRSFTEGIEVSVSVEADKENPLAQNEMDDYQYLCNLAKLTGSSFCMLKKKLYFGKNILCSGELRESYEWGKNLISFSRNVELSGQIGSVTVHGSEPDTIRKFSSTASPPGGSGRTASQLCSAVKGKTRERFNKTVRDQNQAKAYAESLMFDSAINFCTGSAQVLGTEKLLPGDKVKFDGLDPQINGEYIVTSLTHSFGGGGFLTTIGFARTTA